MTKLGVMKIKLNFLKLSAEQALKLNFLNAVPICTTIPSEQKS
jgi:hypothetical protein